MILPGWLRRSQPFRKTHDLAEIGRQCAAIDVSLEPLLKRAESLTAYAWAFRYPGCINSGTDRAYVRQGSSSDAPVGAKSLVLRVTTVSPW
jgi:hypothetical protein